MAKIYLVRHCEAEGNVTRRMQANAEALVTARGYAQCECLRRRFEGVHIDADYSSDAFRAIQTALPLAEERGLRLRVGLLCGRLPPVSGRTPPGVTSWRNTPRPTAAGGKRPGI